MSELSRVAIVTGATSGIGEAVARRFVAAGIRTVGSGRNAAKLASLAAELGPGFHGVAGDVSDAALLDELFAAPPAVFGQVADIVVANAGRGVAGAVKDADLAQFEEVLRTNVYGTAAVLQRAARQLLALQADRFPRQAADIVVVGSVVGRVISPFGATYSASKFAVHTLAEALRRDVAPHGVRVALVEPGIVVTGFQAAAGYSDQLVAGFHDKFGPLLCADDVAETIQYLVGLPPHINLSDVVIRPTRQDAP
ncbi:MAG: SDR family oxidoreductase [Fimbriimonadaceae bacterium]|nr:SDR family oxidoreductase [Fimbriimonadaceae bacterium]